jgi:hypothetical protein
MNPARGCACRLGGPGHFTIECHLDAKRPPRGSALAPPDRPLTPKPSCLDGDCLHLMSARFGASRLDTALQAARRSWAGCSLSICEALGGNWEYPWG